MQNTKIRIMVILAASCAAPLYPADQSAGRSSVDRPVTSREIERLSQEISDTTRSNIEGMFDYHIESGDLNNRLDYWRYGAQLNYKWKPTTMLYLRGVGTSYLTQGRVLDEQGINVTAGIRHSLSDSADVRFEAGGTRFSTDESTVNALGSLEFKLSGGSSVHVTGSRTNVEESLLSATGIRPQVGPFAGKLVGQVMDNRIRGGGSFKLFPRLDVFAEGGAGTRTGKNVESNPFRQAGGGAGYNLVAASNDKPLSLARASYSLDYFSFDKDLLGFGGASLLDRRGRPIPITALGSDGVSPASVPGRPGVGGYFSPDYFVSNVGRIELEGRPDPNLEFRLSGFAGTQNYTGSDTRAAYGLSGTVTFRVSERFSIPVTYLQDNFGPFRQHSLLIRLVARL